MVAHHVIAQRKRGQRCHLQRPAAPTNLENARGLQPALIRVGSRGCGSAEEGDGGGLAVRRAVQDLQADVRIELAVHPADHIGQAERRGHPACNARAPALQRPGVGRGVKNRQIHDQPRAVVLHEGEWPRHGQFARITRAVQGLFGHGNGQHFKAQRLEVFTLQGFDVGDGSVHLTFACRAHRVARKPALAHVVGMRGKGRCRQLQDEGHAPQAQPGLTQLQGLHIGLELLPVNALGALEVPLHPPQHHLVGGHPVLEVVGDLVGRGLKVLVTLGLRVAFLALPVQERETQRQQGNERREHAREPAIAPCVRDGGRLHGGLHCRAGVLGVLARVRGHRFQDAVALAVATSNIGNGMKGPL